MSLSGALQDFTLADVLTFLCHGGKSGALRLERLGDAGSIYLDDGQIYYAAPRRTDQLGADLVAAGVLSVDLWEEVRNSTTIAVDAIAAGVPEERLHGFLEQRVGDALFSIARWTEGDFRFHPGASHPVGAWLRLSLEPVLATLQHRLEEWQAMSGTLPSAEHRVRLRAGLDNRPEVTLRAGEWQVVVAIGEGDDHLPLAEIGRAHV